jgi:trimeric autotransporter adhesin
MNKFYSIFAFLLLFNIILLPQTGSVELRDSSGALLSTYSSITEAYNAIPTTLTQRYLIEILSAYNGSTEVFPVILGNRTGASVYNSITIRPAAGNTGETVTTNLTNNSTLIFDNCSYVTVDGRPGGIGSAADMILENTNAAGTSTYAVHFRNGASNNTLRYCAVKSYTMDAAGPRTIYFGLSASNPKW